MSALKRSGNVTIVAMILVAALALGFWVLLLGPKREEAAKLGEEVAQVESSLAGHRAEVAAAEAARSQFPVDYQRLVVLGKAVPASDETASLLVQLTGVAERAGVEFSSIALSAEGGGGGGEEEAAAAPASSSGEPVSATEAAASLMPLGAAIGPAGLAVMPYTLTFNGSFFQIADFIKGLDAMVKSHNEGVAVKGRLVTVNNFSLGTGESSEPGEPSSGGSSLTATFSVTTYLTPPDQGITAGASPVGPEESTATPAATTTGGAP
jgi:Tfp pilus assembly protein PilO